MQDAVPCFYIGEDWFCTVFSWMFVKISLRSLLAKKMKNIQIPECLLSCIDNFEIRFDLKLFWMHTISVESAGLIDIARGIATPSFGYL